MYNKGGKQISGLSALWSMEGKSVGGDEIWTSMGKSNRSSGEGICGSGDDNGVSGDDGGVVKARKDRVGPRAWEGKPRRCSAAWSSSGSSFHPPPGHPLGRYSGTYLVTDQFGEAAAGSACISAKEYLIILWIISGARHVIQAKCVPGNAAMTYE
ncbi:hypothetical protein Tco_1154459 [Tanacetum coccineum]